VVLQIIKSLIKLIGLIAVVYILLMIDLICHVGHCHIGLDLIFAIYLPISIRRGAITAEKLRGTKDWVPTPGR